jgi:hypothetical protein
MQDQTAKLPKSDHLENAKNWGDTKETVAIKRLTAFDAKGRAKQNAKADKEGWPRDNWAGMNTVVDARWYMGRSSTGMSKVYCSVWVHTRDGRNFSGTGWCGGCGVHKESATFDSAIESAGIKLGMRADYGDTGITDAMTAIAKAAGYGRCPQLIR